MADLKDSSLLDLSALKDLDRARVAIVKTEWNQRWIDKQTEGALHIAKTCQATVSQTLIVPGCVELPFGIRRLYEVTKNTVNHPEAIIAFGLVIRGGTPHFDYVCQTATEGILQLNLTLPIPVIFGILTLDNEQQAAERLGGSHGHKGEEAMITALKMIQINRILAQNAKQP
ncbi:MAG TPA: 6,7-dimethyl-8-ribityllumazine synthase [Edaphocola sp.]|nr:6,7-dimethyl-8-ribityllumazine synthase [Edaphocola sp.]